MAEVTINLHRWKCKLSESIAYSDRSTLGEGLAPVDRNGSRERNGNQYATPEAEGSSRMVLVGDSPKKAHVSEAVAKARVEAGRTAVAAFVARFSIA